MIVAVYLWRIRPSSIGSALAHMALDRLPLKRLQKRGEISFFKLLGTGKGKSFTPTDADATRWALLLCFPESQVDSIDNLPLLNSWRKFATSEVRFLLRPLSAHGLWSGVQPFLLEPSETQWDGEVAAITRAKIVPKKNLTFWRAVPPVSASLRGALGLRYALGIGEAPIGLQGTFSIWKSAVELRNFAYKTSAHHKAIEQTRDEKWYSEELFARFAIVEQRGELNQR